MRSKSSKPLAGQLSLFSEGSEDTQDSLTVPQGLYGRPYAVGFDIPELPSTGPAVRHGWQVMRDVETLNIGWPESEEEADFYRKRIRKYLKTISEMKNDK